MKLLSSEAVAHLMCSPGEGAALPPATPVKSDIANWLGRLDAKARDSGKVQEWRTWVGDWAVNPSPSCFASAMDYYHIFKAIKTACETGSTEERTRAQTLLASLHKEWKEQDLLTSTLIQEAPEGFVSISHHASHPDPLYRLEYQTPIPERGPNPGLRT